ncbi:probable serine/threonine-protein kinase DDB_G0282963 [Macrobrachium nipponense]|uniref:probable serine/threonine-protein kinase DDB_G0282963 n=1 Tax=Macrobrachium nipponense TaxID=159736 RepID=UPI0030C88CE9
MLDRVYGLRSTPCLSSNFSADWKMRVALVTNLVVLFCLSKPVAGSAIRPKGGLLNVTQPEVRSPKTQKWFELEPPPRQRFVRSKNDACPPSQPDPAASIFNFLSSTVLVTNVAVNMIVSINTYNNNNNNNDNNNNNNDNNFNSNSLMFTSMNTNMNTAMLPGKRKRRSRTTTNAECSCESETPDMVEFRTGRESTGPDSPALEMRQAEAYQNDMRVPETSTDVVNDVSSVSGSSRGEVQGISAVPEIFIDAVSDMYSVSGSSRDGVTGISSLPEISIDTENTMASVPGNSINPENQVPNILERTPSNSTEMSNNPSWNHSEWNVLNWNIMECVSWFICQRLKSKQESSVAAWIMENMTVSILEMEIASFLNNKQIALLRRAIFKGRYSTSCDHLWKKCHSLM